MLPTTSRLGRLSQQMQAADTCARPSTGGAFDQQQVQQQCFRSAAGQADIDTTSLAASRGPNAPLPYTSHLYISLWGKSLPAVNELDQSQVSHKVDYCSQAAHRKLEPKGASQGAQLK